MVDTGSSTLVIDKKLCQDIDLVDLGEVNIITHGRTHKARSFSGIQIGVDQKDYGKPAFHAVDLSSFRLFTGVAIEGAISVRELNIGSLLVDYDNRTFEFYRGTPKISSKEASGVLALKAGGGLPYFDSEINGIKAQFLLDTGYNGSISLPKAVFALLADHGTIEMASESGAGVTSAGRSVFRKGWFRSGQLMTRNLAGHSVSENDSETAFLGAQWLFGFNCDYDFPRREIRYIVRNDAAFPLQVQLMLGAVITFQDGFGKVEGLRQGDGAARNSGLRSSDIIVRWGPVLPGKLNIFTVEETVASYAGKDLPVEVLRGASKEKLHFTLKIPPPISAWDYAGRN